MMVEYLCNICVMQDEQLILLRIDITNKDPAIRMDPMWQYAVFVVYASTYALTTPKINTDIHFIMEISYIIMK